ncbi:hypothetical protein [Martelella mediterranea]|nr:hypothetical protein [Martelella mediterranea]
MLSSIPAAAEYIETYPISTNLGNWVVDRQGTSTFKLLDTYQGRNNVLALGTSPDDANPDSFYRWEGYSQKTTVPAGKSMIGGDIWVNSDWQQGTDSDYIRTSMWGSAMTEAEVATGKYNDNDAVFPIVQFTNQGGTGRLEVWNSNEGGWIDLPETAGIIDYNGWNSIDMRLVTDTNGQGTAIEYYFNNQLIYTWADPESVNETSPEQYFAMYLKNRNNGVTEYTSYWSRLLSGLVFDNDAEIGNVDGDLVAEKGATISIIPGSTIEGPVSLEGGLLPDEQVSANLSGVRVEGSLLGTRSRIIFDGVKAPDGSATTIDGSLSLENKSVGLALI